MAMDFVKSAVLFALEVVEVDEEEEEVGGREEGRGVVNETLVH